MSGVIVWAISDIDKTSFLELSWQLSYYIHYPVNVDLVWGPYPVIIDLTPQTINNYFAFRKQTATTWFVSDRQLKSVGNHKSDNLQHNTLNCWVDCLSNQASDGPSIVLLFWKKNHWVAKGQIISKRFFSGRGFAQKTHYFYLCKVMKK